MNDQIKATPEQAETSSPTSLEEAMRSLPDDRARGLQLASLAGTHALVLLVAFSLFAAADSWRLLSGLGMASALALATGALAGITTTTLIHEWFHYLGARLSGGAYGIPRKKGLFVYDWNFAQNNTDQFFFMSIAGSVGGALSLVLLWLPLPADTLGRAAVHGGAVAGFVFAAVVEWPVLRRVRFGGDPLTALSGIDQRVLGLAFLAASFAGFGTLLLLRF